ncbi:MAG: acyl-ACP--UDP-N-acetylglucosamine O-acyltransferase [Rhizomicrobium sp.]
MAVHPTAIVEEGASLGSAVEIGPFCSVSAGAVLADGVKLVSHVVILGHTEIGTRTIVYPNAVLGGPAQTHGEILADARLVIGANNIVREGVTISAGSRVGGGITRVGDANYLMAYSHIGHDCQVGSNVTLSNGVQLGGHVEIGDRVILGGLAAVQQFSRVGQGAFISGLSGVSTDVIPYGIAIGLHVRLGGLNLIGLRRRNVPRQDIHAARAAYRMIFLEQGSIHDNAERAAAKWPDVAQVREITDFILAPAKRPICPARKRGAHDADEEA